MNTGRSLMEDISKAIETLLKHTMEDQIALKSLDIINSFAQKETTSTTDLLELLDKVESNYESRISAKKEILANLTQQCIQLGNAKIVDAVSVGIGKIANHICTKIDALGEATKDTNSNKEKQTTPSNDSTTSESQVTK